MRSYHYLIVCLALVLCLHSVVAVPQAAARRQDGSPLQQTSAPSTKQIASATVAPSGDTSLSSTDSEPSSTVDAFITPSATASTVIQTPVTTATNQSQPTRSAEKPLPIQPKLTPALGISGVLLLLTGLVYAIIGIRNKWLYIFGSAAYLTALAVTVLIIYLMSPPVSNAIQGAFFVAAFFSGVTLGVLSLVFPDITEGFGCLLGGFCLSMWFLSLRDGGLISSATGRAIFIGCMSAAGYSLSFNHYTRNYGLIASIAFSGATATLLGVDCLARAGWKEFWLYLWNLNDNVFPLNTNTYPLTKKITAELAGVVIITIVSVVSQMRVWKLVKEHPTKSAAQRLEEQQDRDREEEAVGRKIEDTFQKERAQWEAAYGGKSAQDSSMRSSMTNPKGSTSIQEKEVYSTDSLEMVNKSKGGVRRSVNPNMPASTAVTVNVLDDDIRQIDAQGNPMSYQSIEPVEGSDLREKALPHAPETAPSNTTQPIVTKRTSLRPSAPPPAPAVVPLPFTILKEEDANDEEEDNAFVSAVPETDFEDHPYISRRTLDISAVIQHATRNVPEPQEPTLNAPYDEDDRASSVAATMNDDFDAICLRQLSPDHSAADFEKTETRKISTTTDAKAPVSSQPTVRQSLTSEGQHSKSTGSDALSQGSQIENVEPHVGSLQDGLPPQRLSKVALSYRTNEGAKHLEVAENPGPDDLSVPDSRGVVLGEGSEEAPGPVSDETASPLLESKSNPKRVSAESRLNRNSGFGLNRSSPSFSQDSLEEQRLLTQSPPVMSPGVLSRSSSGARLDALSPLPSNTLMGRRENLMKNRTSSQSLTPHTSSANLLADQDEQENMTLAQRRQMLQRQSSSPILQHQTSMTSQRKAPPLTSQKWQKNGRTVKGAPPGFDSHQPKRSSNSQSDQKREELYAGWRDTMRDITPPKAAAYIAEQQRVALMNERRQKEVEKQQREVMQQHRASQMESMMRSGPMLDAHREAMRRMQANANKRA